MSITIRSSQTLRGSITLRSAPDVLFWIDANNTSSYSGGTVWHDISGNGHDVTLHNGASYGDRGINFDYTQSQYADFPETNMFSGDFTILAWVYVRSYQSWSRVLDFGNGAGQSNILLAVSDGASGFPVYSNGNNLDSTVYIVTNQWHQLAAVQEGNTGLLYLDGQLVGSYPNNGGTDVTSRIYNYIGRSNWGSDAYLDGEIASIKIYNRALRSSEILTNYHSTNPLIAITANLQLYLDAGNPNSYPGSGSTWTDIIGSKQFTLIGNPSYSNDNGGYIDFNPNSGQYAQCNSSLATMTHWTIEVWHYFEYGTTGSYPAIVTEIYTGASLNYALGKDAGNGGDGLAIGYYDGADGSSTGWHQTTAVPLSFNNWYHIVGTFDGTTLKLYVNGQLVQTQAGEGSMNSSNAGIRLMSRWDALDLWGGRLGVVRIYNTDIAQVGVTNNFSAERGRFGI
jgi:Concanavalin A-like lectin/glucanases superfamily